MTSNHALDTSPVVLTSMDVRRHIRTLLTRNDIDLPVLAYQEVAPEFSVQPLATIGGELAADVGDAGIEDTPLALESAAQ
jgi:type III secretion protein V